MINRTKINNSIYDILNEDPETIKEYQTNQANKTDKQKQKEQEARNKKSNITDVNLNENLNNQDTNPSNQVVVHTETDNLIHNYFHYFNLYWDAGDPLSGVIIKLPKTDTENTKYWITYSGEVTIYLGNEINKQWQKQDNDGSVNNTSYWSLKGMLPIFRGEVGVIKEYQKVLEIHIDSIGKRFKQKIPNDFRQAYINNQNVRDAFQAICEFLGIKYICPPAQPKTQDEEQEDETPQSDGTENNVNDKTTQEQQLANAANNVIKQVQNNQNGKNNDENSNDQTQNTDSQIALNESTEQSDIQNGYSDISFDANGSIVHGSVAIETSPNMEDTLLALEEHPLDKYLEDTTYISVDVKKFLNGEMFDTVHGNYLDYNAITIEPKSSGSSEMSNVSGGTMDSNGDGVVSEDEAKQYGQNLLNTAKGNVALTGITFTNNSSSKIALSYDQVNSMSFIEAKKEAQKTDKYYYTTIVRLRARAALYNVSPSTPYGRFYY